MPRLEMNLDGALWVFPPITPGIVPQATILVLSTEIALGVS